MLPGHKTLGAVTRILSGPKACSAPPIDSFDDGLMKADGRHKVEREGAKDSGSKGEAPSYVKKRRPPA